MNAVEYVKCIETLTIKDTIGVMRVITEDDKQIIGLPMFTSQKSGGGLKKARCYNVVCSTRANGYEHYRG